MPARTFFLALVLVLVAGCGSSAPRQSTPQPVPSSTPTPPAPASVETFRPADEVVANGQQVAYRVCAEWRTWSRLPMTEMAPVFNDRRFQVAGGRVHPIDYAIYLSNFNYVPVPTANSANRDVVAFTGMTLSFGREAPAVRCDDSELPRNLGSWVELWVAGHRVVDLRQTGSQLVAVVEPAAGVFQQVAFPYPPPAASAAQDIGAVQVVDRAGHLLYESRTRAPGWIWQASEDGRLTFAHAAGEQRFTTSVLPLGGQKLRVYAAGNVPQSSPSGGSIDVLDISGSVVATKAWQPWRAWDVVMDLDLPPDDYRLRLTGAAVGGVLVLPAETQLPPPVPVTETNAIEFVPPSAVSNVTDGSCFGPSLAVHRPVAWRCITAGSMIQDPCFQTDVATRVVCVKDPARPGDAMALNLRDPLRASPGPLPAGADAWAVELESGALCYLQLGTSSVINGDRVDYTCTDGTALLGALTPGAVWTARQIAGAGMPPAGRAPHEDVVKVRTVWR